MKVEKKALEKSQLELTVQVDAVEFEQYLERGAVEVSKNMKLEGFRPGKVPYDILKSKVGDMVIMEAAAHILIKKTVDQLIKDNVENQVIGQPQISLTKLIPGQDLEYKVVMDILPTVKLGEHKGFDIEIKKETVSDEEVVKVIDQLREAQVKEVSVEREAAVDDKLICDFRIFLDKVPVDGGNAKGVAIILGKDYIVPGVDKNLIGIKKGEERSFEIIYPADHYQKNLAGKRTEFEVKVSDVFERQLPEVNDEFVKNFGLKDKQELESNIKTSMQKEKDEKAEQKAELTIIEKIVANSELGEIPATLLDHETDLMLHEMEHNLSHQGANLEDYLSSVGKTKEQLTQDFLPDATKRVQSALIMRQIIIDEKIDLDEKIVDEEINKMQAMYKQNAAILERINKSEYRHGLANQMLQQKAIDLVRTWNVK
jgi:trigger factor